MEIKVPEVGESVMEALVAKWHSQDGDWVHRNQTLCEIETDKITMELTSEAEGRLIIKIHEGTMVKIGSVIGIIDEQAVPAEGVGDEGTKTSPEESRTAVSPSIRKLAREKDIPLEQVAGTGKGGRVTIEDIFSRLDKDKDRERHPFQWPEESKKEEEGKEKAPPREGAAVGDKERVTRVAMTPIRRRTAERLLAARQQTAMLTTFNEADMTRVVAIRQRYRDEYRKKHGVSLGLMPFFIKACVEALQEFPPVNARIEGNDLIYHHFYDIGVAVSSEKGLVVPVLRNADRLHFWEMEKGIDDFVERTRNNKLTLADLEGGTFTISNGGVFGSLLSTPILNPPQSAVLGMHAIQDRPVAKEGQVVIRPMMYLALSYDHRIIDGRTAVQFLKRVKEYIEEPEEMLLDG